MHTISLKMRSGSLLMLGLAMLTACCMPAQASPNFANYQGLLTGADGQAVPDSTYQVQFRLHTLETGGTAFYISGLQTVQTLGGLFAAPISPITSADLVGKSSVWLETWTALPPAPMKALSPRVKLAAVPYALVVPWSGVEGAPTSFPPSGPAGGDLSGTYPNPTIAVNAVTGSRIADGSITNADISPTAAISDTKIAGSGTLVTNLNADKLDGLNASDLTTAAASPIKQVVRGTVDFSPGTYDVTQTLTATINPAKSIVEFSGPVNTGASTSTLERQACLISLTATQIRIATDRVIPSGVTLRVGYQIVEYN